MTKEDLKDKLLSLIVWNTAQENDVHVYLGKIIVDQFGIHFFNHEKNWRLTLDDPLLSRIRAVDDNLKETLLNADYAISLTLGELPGSELGEYTNTGMKWHDPE